MRTRSKQSGLTLPELAVVIATIALLVGFALPAIRALLNSFETQSGAKTMISAALSTARAIAAKEQRYAGVRFQQDLAGNQYMIFIVQDPKIMAYGFRAIEGNKPIKLPDSIGVMDLCRVRRDYNPSNYQTYIVGETTITSDAMITGQSDLTDITTFSIVFSPSGKLVIHQVRVLNRDGFVDRENTRNLEFSYDDVFNKKQQVDRKHDGYGKNDVPPGAGMFYQDDYFDPDLNTDGDLGLGPELSRKSFVIYEKDKFRQAYNDGDALTDYLAQTARSMIYINAYMGTMILPD